MLIQVAKDRLVSHVRRVSYEQGKIKAEPAGLLLTSKVKGNHISGCCTSVSGISEKEPDCYAY